MGSYRCSRALFPLQTEALQSNATENSPAENSQLKTFYSAIANSEKRHYQLFLQLAELYFPPQIIQDRFIELLDIEADIVAKLPIQPKLH